MTTSELPFTNKYTSDLTLDEPVKDTIMRDVRMVGYRLKLVILPKDPQKVVEELRDWDLWGPLFICLFFSVYKSKSIFLYRILCLNNAKDQAVVFTIAFVIEWLGAGVVTLNAQLLGGKVSFFQSLCVLGYSLFPIAFASFIVIFLRSIWFKLPLVCAAFYLTSRAANIFFSPLVAPERKLLVLYPLYLFYFIISSLVLGM